MQVLFFYIVVALLIFAIAMLSVFKNAVPQVSEKKRVRTILVTLGVSALWGLCLVGFLIWLIFFNKVDSVKES